MSASFIDTDTIFNMAGSVKIPYSLSTPSCHIHRTSSAFLSLLKGLKCWHFFIVLQAMKIALKYKRNNSQECWRWTLIVTILENILFVVLHRVQWYPPSPAPTDRNATFKAGELTARFGVWQMKCTFEKWIFASVNSFKHYNMY